MSIFGECEVCGTAAIGQLVDLRLMEPISEADGLLYENAHIIWPVHALCGEHWRDPVVYPQDKQ